MEVAFTECVTITDVSSVGEARRSANSVAARLGLNETQAGELAIVTTEASRNVLVHGGGGQVIVAGFSNQVGPVARILALDKGAGIGNVAEAMSDGYSTAGTMGTGMGAMKRLATRFEVFTGTRGTAVLIELGDSGPISKVQFAGIALPYPGERLCGDAWLCSQTPERTIAVIADGLGHGIGAAEAADEAISIFHARSALSPADILSYIHDALKKTRGAVAGLVEICPARNRLTYAGIGNISASVVTAGVSRSLASHNGTLGMTVQRIQEFHGEWNSDSIFVMHSDGLQTKWDLQSYAGLISRHPALICGVLMRDFRRLRDDASVVVLKAA
jgi:anti-sigma regulatory factor (Ser/Thr protein kinase)